MNKTQMIPDAEMVKFTLILRRTAGLPCGVEKSACDAMLEREPAQQPAIDGQGRLPYGGRPHAKH